MEAYLVEWLNLGVRWLHFTAGIAWIGSSLYFVMLDNSLRKPANAAEGERGVHGELWAVHGGGFYCSQKFLTGPRGEPLSEHLHWSKWEAYTTWLSGIALLVLIYWVGANAFLVDRSVLELTVPAAIAISAGSLVAGWLVYDGLCRLVRNQTVLALLLYALLVAAAWGYGHVFGARAAYIHVGALIGTWMVGNVFFHIIPGQKKMVAALRAGQPVDPLPGIIGKQRSVHNTYFTLPLLFIMISNHYPMTYGNAHAWAVLGVLMLAGALIRQFFVLRHTGRVVYALPAVGVALVVGLVVALAPHTTRSASSGGEVTFAQVQPIIATRCAVCHAEKPSFTGFVQPPAGVLLDTPERIRAAAPRIQQQAITTQAMPLGNLTQMTSDERALLGRWFAAGTP
jgi:uncharacterized membrane protein